MATVNKKSDIEIANEKAERIMNAVSRLTAYYRANIHRFAEEYLGLSLRLFQKICLFMMEYSTNFMFIAARGLGKSFLIAIYNITFITCSSREQIPLYLYILDIF